MNSLRQFVFLMLTLISTAVVANDGGTVSPFNFGAGARELSLGGAAIAESDFATAPFWNPSRLAVAERYGIYGFHSTLYDSDVAYQYLGAVVPTLDYGCFGVGIFRLGVNGIEERDAGNLLLGEISDSRLGLNLAYGNKISGYEVGLTMTMEHHSLGSYKSTSSPGLNVALGKRIELGNGRLDHLSLSLLGRNLLQPTFNLSGQSVSYPLTAIAGIAIGMKPNPKWNHTARLFASLTKIDWLESRLAVGFEYSLPGLLDARVGFNDGRLSFGVGLEYRNISFDYALVDRDMGSLHMFSLSTAFGKSTSERRELKMLQRETHFNNLMNERLTTRNREMVSELVEAGRRYLELEDLVKASSNFDRALFLARASNVDTSQISDLAKETARHMNETEHLYRLGLFLDSAEIGLAKKDYLTARYYANLALVEEPGSIEADSFLQLATAAINELSSKDNLIEKRLRTVDSLLNYGQIDQASSIVSDLEPYTSDYPNIALASKRVALEEWKSSATEAINQQKHALAIAILDSALALYPGHRWCTEMRNQAALEMSQMVTVIDPETPAKAQPLSNELRKEVAVAYSSAQKHFEKGNLLRAVEDWKRVERLAPDYQSVREYLVNAYKFVGVQFYSQNQLREAVATWKKAIALTPANNELTNYITRTETEIRKLQELSYDSE